MTLSDELSINSTEPTSSEGKENLVRFSSRLDYKAVIACPNERANMKKEARNVCTTDLPFLKAGPFGVAED